jgi:predicted transcriptional regulator
MEPRPTNSEVDILSVLWRLGPSTVRDVYEDMNTRREIGYTTVLKLLQIMFEKGIVERNEESRAHIYSPIQAQAETQRTLIDDLVERAFGGSAHKLALNALSSTKATPEELAEIRSLLDQLEEKK